MTVPFRESIAAMMELIATSHPALLPAYLDMASNGPARFAVLELAADFRIKDPRDFCEAAVKVAADLDRLERDRSEWTHPRQVVQNPNIEALLYFCRARMQSATGTARRRRLKNVAQKLRQARQSSASYSWVAEFVANSRSSTKAATDQGTNR